MYNFVDCKILSVLKTINPITGEPEGLGLKLQKSDASVEIDVLLSYNDLIKHGVIKEIK